MPTYEYRCEKCCFTFEKISSIKDMERTQECPYCKEIAKLQVSKGFTFGDEAAWINDHVRGSLQDDSQIRKNPIKTRSELNSYLKKNDLIEVG